MFVAKMYGLKDKLAETWNLSNWIFFCVFFSAQNNHIPRQINIDKFSQKNRENLTYKPQ